MPKAKASRVPETDTEVAFKDSSSFTITFTIQNFSGLQDRTKPIFSSDAKLRASTCYVWVIPKKIRKGHPLTVQIFATHEVEKCPKDTSEPAARIKISIPTSAEDPQTHIVNYTDVSLLRYLYHDDIWGEDAEEPLSGDVPKVCAEFKLLCQEAISEELPRDRRSDFGRDFTLVSADEPSVTSTKLS
ncbi:hypothetical protein RvY_11147-1 [Ramazzottius varieornatus]|uniref:Uncharacterized protein n=1 Tax=Ramazzottius varieornatus TaxID=947166 RepID=A0A1D1VF80_RAMVA|nr:hypothetical protein RvY_11147-1 [Ramazzottius varieornatus]